MPEAREPIPLEAMEKCGELSKLESGFSELDVEVAVDILAVSRTEDVATHATCKLKQEELAAWIERNG